jgi:hypothetical protein
MIDLSENDFGVMLRPILDAEGDDPSFGNLEVAVFSNLMPEVDDGLHAQYMFIAYKMAALLSFCEDYPEFDEMLNEHTEALVSQLGDEYGEEEPTIKPKSKVTSTLGNVITLDFNTKCEGEG